MKSLRRYFVAGLLVWTPIAVTFLLLRLVVGMMDKTLQWLPPHYRPEEWLPFAVPGLGLLLTLALVLVTGILVANIVGRSMVGVWESVLKRIPIVRSIYMASKNFAEVVLSDSGQSFKKVLMIEYPRKGIYSLAFQTGTRLGEIEARTGREVLSCFVPTTPNPTSGFIIVVPKEDVIELDMQVDEALKLIISLGVVVPTWRGDRTRELPLEMPPQPKGRKRAKD
ncbi:MAG: DUF502 domain-containing protein [Halioglobus sp.]|nr:DUF502 domain-containing protein [Halioglobus sp.]